MGIPITAISRQLRSGWVSFQFAFKPLEEWGVAEPIGEDGELSQEAGRGDSGISCVVLDLLKQTHWVHSLLRRC